MHHKMDRSQTTSRGKLKPQQAAHVNENMTKRCEQKVCFPTLLPDGNKKRTPVAVGEKYAKILR